MIRYLLEAEFWSCVSAVLVGMAAGVALLWLLVAFCVWLCDRVDGPWW